MTTRTILSRSGRIATLMAGTILLALTGAASARVHGGGFHKPILRGTTQAQPANSLVKPAQPASSLLKQIPVKTPPDVRSPGYGTPMSRGNGLPSLPTTSGNGRNMPSGSGASQTGTRTLPTGVLSGGDRRPTRVLEY
jgi:hypothetical protein